MRALVYHGPGQKAWEDVSDPEITAIEAVGAPVTFELAVKLARPGGRIANIGVHGRPAIPHLEREWIRDITITTGQLAAGRFITHRFSMDEFEKAYDVFGDAAATGALKVVLTREEDEDL